MRPSRYLSYCYDFEVYKDKSIDGSALFISKLLAFKNPDKKNVDFYSTE